ncbi:hypothetical protein CB1_000998029 [Camelus ferus]|nr:hypothetical protein CB1_000998029 [Camelus ferus]
MQDERTTVKAKALELALHDSLRTPPGVLEAHGSCPTPDVALLLFAVSCSGQRTKRHRELGPPYEYVDHAAVPQRPLLCLRTSGKE